MNNADTDLYELHWNNHTNILKGTFDIFRNDNELVDVTLSCEGKKLKAHKIVLSACSDYFLDLFRDNPCHHPIIIMRDVGYKALVNILNFMYMGEINITTEELNPFLKTAESLQVKGIAVEKSLGSEFNKSNLLNDKHTEKLLELGKKKRTSVDNDKQNNTYQKTSKIAKLSDVNKNIQESKTEDSNDTLKYYEEVQTDVQRLLSNSKELTGKSVKRTSKHKEAIYNDNSFEASHPPLDIDQMKTEIIDLDILADDSIKLSEFEAQEQQEYSSTLAQIALNKTYPCKHCKKVFNHYISLKLHLPSHSGDTSCHLCDAVLGRKYDLKVHMRRKHNIVMDEYLKISQPLDIASLEQAS